MSNWYGLMAQKNLLFHPDDTPEDVVKISNGVPTFNSTEQVQLIEIMQKIFNAHGDQVYKAACPYSMKTLVPYPVG